MTEICEPKEFQKRLHDFYNNGKYSKILDSELNDNLINTRIVSEENFGTVKYVGNIPKSNGLWLGIDWDDPKRGRHNGIHNGIKYFETKSETSGSFVRPNKISKGLTIEEAINVRYGAGDENMSNYTMDEFYLESSGSEDECGTNSKSRKTIGQGKQKVKVEMSGPSSCAFNINVGAMDRLKALVLHSLPIYRCLTEQEGGNKLNEMVPCVQELDVAQTLLYDWLNVSLICRQLPLLKNLTMSDNKVIPLFPNPTDISDFEYRNTNYKRGFNSVVYLIIVRIYYSWSEFRNLFEYFPKLEHLCMAYNKLSVLDPCLHDSFTNLTYLDLACNNLIDFQQCILPFGSLKKLDTLLLNENKFSEMVLPGRVSELSDLFPSLRLLAISNNNIDSWGPIHHIGRLQALRELIFMFNPILDKQKNLESARQDVIAKVPRIKMLNRNDIKYEERKGAEIDYLKRYGIKYLEAQPKDTDTPDIVEEKKEMLKQFEIEHPRFMRLVDLYGAPEDSEMKDVTRKLRDKLIEVQFEYVDLKTKEIKLVSKKIPNNMTVQHLRNLLRRVCKLSGKHDFSLSYINSCRPDIKIPLEADTREIGFYNVQNGDLIIVHVI